MTCFKVLHRGRDSVALLFVWALFSTSAMGGGSLLWYDGFSLESEGGDYVAGTALNGTSGGSSGGSDPFFTGNWEAADQDDDASWAHAQANGLDRPGLTVPVVGGAAGREVQFDCCVFTRTSRLFADPWGGFTDPDGTFYMGFLIDFGDTGFNEDGEPDPHHRTVEMHSGGFDDGVNRNLILGISSFVGEVGNEMSLVVRDSSLAGGFGDQAVSSVLAEGADILDLSVQGTHYVVMKFDMSTSSDDVISVFLDPVGTDEPAPSASITVGQFLADRLSTNAQFTFNTGDPTAAGQFDELRVSTNFADVAVNTVPFVGVPEPSTIVLAGIALGGLFIARCSSRNK